MKLREQIKKIVQNSHDCAELGCWDKHEDSVDSILQAFEEKIRKTKPKSLNWKKGLAGEYMIGFNNGIEIFKDDLLEALK